MMQNLNNVFNLPDDDDIPTSNTLVVINPPPAVVVKEETESIEADFEKARESLHTIVQKGTKAVEDLEQLASLSQNAEHYAALATMIKNVSDVSKVLMGVHTEKAKVKKPATGKVENHLHISASTMEIAKLLKEENKDND